MAHEGTFPPTVNKLFPPYWSVDDDVVDNSGYGDDDNDGGDIYIISDQDDDTMEDTSSYQLSMENVNEAMIPSAETESNIFKQQDNSTSEQIETLLTQIQSTTRKPPQAVDVTSESLSVSDANESSDSLVIRKRKPRDPSSTTSPNH